MNEQKPLLALFGQFTGFVQRALSRNGITTLLALKMRNQCNGVIGHRLSLGIDIEKNGEKWIIDLIAPNAEFFIDVGANVGSWSMEFARRMPQAPHGLVFEPSPTAAECLRKVLSDAKYENIEIVQKAIESSRGKKPFFAEPDMGETSSLLKNHSNSKAARIMVDVTRLDDELNSRNIEFVDFLKIDAEGFDFFVMKGAEQFLRSKKINIIQFEYNSPWAQSGTTLTAAVRFLDDLGYNVHLLKGNNLFILNIEKYGEYFSYSNFIAYCNGPHAHVLDKIRKQEI